MTRFLPSTILLCLLQRSTSHRVRSVIDNRRALFKSEPSFPKSYQFLQARGGGSSDYNDPPQNLPSYGEDENRYADDRYESSSPRRSDSLRYAYDEDDRYYERDFDDRGTKRSSPSIPGAPSFPGNFANIVKNGDRGVGLAFLGAGTVFTMLGVSLFFNKSLMRLGNLLFIFGVPLTIGPGRTAGYFFQPKKSRATACLALGIFLVFIGSPVIGIVLEIFGLLNLFGNMFPILFAVLKNMPVVGTLFKSGGGSSRTRRSYDDNDDRYEDDYRRDYRSSDKYDEDQRYGDYDGGSDPEKYY